MLLPIHSIHHTLLYYKFQAVEEKEFVVDSVLSVESSDIVDEESTGEA